MNKREAKKFAYGTIAGFIDAELPSILEMVETDPDVKRSATDLLRIQCALEEVIAELRRKTQ